MYFQGTSYWTIRLGVPRHKSSVWLTHIYVNLSNLPCLNPHISSKDIPLSSIVSQISNSNLLSTPNRPSFKSTTLHNVQCIIHCIWYTMYNVYDVQCTMYVMHKVQCISNVRTSGYVTCPMCGAAGTFCQRSTLDQLQRANHTNALFIAMNWGAK